MEHDLFQFFVDDLLLRFGEVGAGLVQRSGLHDETQRCRRDRVWSKLDLPAEFACRKVVTVAFEPEQSAAVCVGHEFTLAGVEIIGYRGWRRPPSSMPRSVARMRPMMIVRIVNTSEDQGS